MDRYSVAGKILSVNVWFLVDWPAGTVNYWIWELSSKKQDFKPLSRPMLPYNTASSRILSGTFVAAIPVILQPELVHLWTLDKASSSWPRTSSDAPYSNTESLTGSHASSSLHPKNTLLLVIILHSSHIANYAFCSYLYLQNFSTIQKALLELLRLFLVSVWRMIAVRFRLAWQWKIVQDNY